MAVTEATDKNIYELIKNGYSAVDFYGDSCGACAYSAPFFREAADDMAFINFIKINTSRYPELAARFHVVGLPTFIFFLDGKEIYRKDGGMNREMINAALAAALYSDNTKKAEKSLNKKVSSKGGKKGRIRLNEDQEIVAKIREGLKNTGGYCPCLTERNEDTKCICRDFREKIEDPEYEGYCHCMLYYKEL